MLIGSQLFSLVVWVCGGLLIIASTSNCELHRAKAINLKPHHAGRTAILRNKLEQSQQCDFAGSLNVSHDGPSHWSKGLTDGDKWLTCLYALVSAGLVGLSGIFPLLVIPIEAGEALKKGGSANNKLKLLLSFAVGCLLGDVFLHLLPEAWAHLDKLGGTHDGNINIGCWVLAGLLVFMIIEKLFPESNEDDDDEDVTSVCQELDHESKQIQCDFGQCHGRYSKKYSEYGEDGSLAKQQKNNGSCSLTDASLNGSYFLTSDGKLKKRTVLAAETKKIKHELGGEIHQTLVVKRETQIKTSGWLNLMANVIDNFTHGLAVAGSYSVSVKTGLITTFAILLHEIPHEIGDFAILLRSGFDRWRAAKAQMLTATGGILGALAALNAESAECAGDRSAWILPFTAGGFIYIAMVSVLPELLHEKMDAKQSLKQFFLVCTGISVMAAITLLFD